MRFIRLEIVYKIHPLIDFSGGYFLWHISQNKKIVKTEHSLYSFILFKN